MEKNTPTNPSGQETKPPAPRRPSYRTLAISTSLLIVLSIILLKRGARTPDPPPPASESVGLPDVSRLSAQISGLSRELAAIRKEIASMGAAVPPSPGTPAALAPSPTSATRPATPPQLLSFLEEARKDSSLQAFTPQSLERTRADLVALVNGLSASHRDELRLEIADANWLLEAHEIAATQIPEGFEEQLGRAASLSILREEAPEGVAESIVLVVESRYDEIVQRFSKELEDLRDSFQRRSPGVSDEALGRTSLIADFFDADGIEHPLAMLPALIESWNQWQKDQNQHVWDTPSTAQSFFATEARLLEDGSILESLFHSIEVAPPAELKQGIEQLRQKIVSREEEAINRYQLMALEEIQAVREFAGDQASGAISGTLSRGKSSPGEAGEDFRKLMAPHPMFRAKVNELAGIRKRDWSRRHPNDESVISTIANSRAFGRAELRELAQLLNRDILEQRLLPIEEGLLRRPLDALYSEVFQACWDFLEGSPHRIEVAKTAATIKKKSIDLP